jgi:hypothetical protein
VTIPAFRSPVSAILIILLTAVCWSESLVAIVTDHLGQRREICAVTTNKGNFLEVLDGPAYRKIPIAKVHNMLIRNNATASRDGELYYTAELWLTDSTKILSYLLPNGQRTEAFVNITPMLKGKTAAGSYEIPLKDVRQLRFVKKGK